MYSKHFTSSRGASWASVVSAGLTSQQWNISDAYDNVYAVSDLTTDSDKVYQLYFEYYRVFLLGKYNGIADRTYEETFFTFFKV